LNSASFFAHLPDVVTSRLRLRRLTMNDVPDMYEYCSDPEVARHVMWDAHTHISDTRSYLRYVMRQYRGGEPSSWGIEHRQLRKLIGTIGFMWIQREHNSAEVGYSLSRAFWNQGLMTEALIATLDVGFNQLLLNRIEAQHEVANPASGVVMRKAGMSCEGRLRGRLYNKGRYVDVDLYAVLRQDFVSRVGRPGI